MITLGEVLKSRSPENMKRCWFKLTVCWWSWKLKSANECVTIEVLNGRALEMVGAHACGRHSIKVVARCGNEETFGNTRVHNLTRHHATRGRSSWTLNFYPSPLRLKLMCCKRQTLKKRTHNARVAGEILVETSGLRNGCWVQLNAIGVAKPLSLFVETHGTEQGLTADEITNVLNKEGDRNPGPLVVYPTLRAPRISAGAHLGHSTIHSSATCIRRRMAKSVVKSGTSERCLVQLLHEIAVAKPF